MKQRLRPERLLQLVERGLGLLCGVLLALLLASMMLGVSLRYLAGSGVIGTEEASVWLLLALVCAGLPLASGGPLAIRMDLFSHSGPAWLRQALAVLADAIVLLACAVLVTGGGEAAGRLASTSPILGIAESWRPVLLAAGGSVALLLVALRHIASNRLGQLGVATLVAGLLFALGGNLSVATELPPSLVLGVAAGVGLLAGAPLAHAFIAAAFIAVPFGSLLPVPALAMSVVSGMTQYLFLAIPCFLLAGGLLSLSGIAGDLVRFAAALVGHRRSGLGQTVLLTGVMFSGTSGSSIANAGFGASVFMPQLTRRGYTPEQAGALVAAVSVLDNIIPPSIAFLILGAATDLSIGRLLAGGFVAGLVMALALALAIRFSAQEKNVTARSTADARWRAAASALPAFGLGVIVVAGIRFGIVSPTEAAALAAAYTLLAALKRKVALGQAFARAGAESAAILLLIGSAAPFAFMLATDGMTGHALAFSRLLGGDPLLVMLMINVALLFIGLFLDIGAAIVLFAPIFLAAAVAAGIDPIAFGVILVVNLMIGGLTPPVGILVQVVARASGVPAAALFAASRPYLAALLAALAAMSITAAFFAVPHP